MAEMVGSIVVGEVVSRTSSFLIGRRRRRLSAREGVERLEMAHIRMEAALEVSARWRGTADAPLLLRWRRRLRRAAAECDDALRRWKLRELREEADRERLARAPLLLGGRAARAVLRFVSALLALARRGGWDEASRDRAAVERFERLADGAAEFLRCVAFNAAPRKRRLLQLGDGVERGYGMLQGGAGARNCFLASAAGSESPAEVWMGGGKPCRGYGKRRASGKKLLLV